jgi:hypothetical protein
MTNYDNFAHTFSNSRKNLKWSEIEYFLSSPLLTTGEGLVGVRVLDV